MSGADSGNGDAVAAVIKVFDLLNVLANGPHQGITEIAEQAGMPKSTVHRFLATMKSLGYVAQDANDEKYSLRLKLFELGAAALEQQDLIALADPWMRVLSDQTHETVHLGAMEDDRIIYLHKLDARYSLRMYSRVGRRNPLHSTAIGKVLLAFMSEQEQASIIEQLEFTLYTPHTLTNKAALSAQLQEIKASGVAEDAEEMEAGLRCIGVPVFDRLGRVHYALSLSLPLMRFDASRKSSLIRALHQCAAGLSADLGASTYPFSH